MSQHRKIAILGAGNVGGALGRLWSAKGHEIAFGVPDPKSEKVTKALAAIQSAAKPRVTGNADAAKSADIVVLTVPWPAAREAIDQAGQLSGKIVIDCTNPLQSDLKALAIGVTTSAGEQVAAWAHAAKVVKAFNTLGAPDLGNARFGDQVADGFYCGDDADAKKMVAPLIEDAGLNPVDVGPLRNARLLEPLALLWIDLAINQRQGVEHAFKLLRR